MLAIRSLFLIALFASSFSVAKPVEEIYKLRYERSDVGLDVRDQAALTGPVTFQTVTTTVTQAGTITQTCTITLTPITSGDGSQQVLEEKECKLEVASGNNPPPSNNGNGSSSSDTSGQTTTAIDSTATNTATDSVAPTTFFATSPAATAVPPISEIGVGTIPASGDPNASDSTVSVPAATSSAAAAPPAVSVVGPNQIPNASTGTLAPASSSAATTPVTVVTTLSNGQVSTSISTPSAAAAQEAAATTPGRKLEVLPIGLGVFAGVSVIALIVVGLVTYERTKYRKAFRQRKLAEAGANMGYGGMAERT